MDAAAVVLGFKLTTSDLSRITVLFRSYQTWWSYLPETRLWGSRAHLLRRAPRRRAARAPHDPWAARLSSTKQVGRPFLGSINALPAVAETMRARAEVILAATPAVGQPLGRAHHHRVVATVTVRAHSRDR